jgi:hypothetical protein
MKDPLTEDLAEIRRFRARRLEVLLRERATANGTPSQPPKTGKLRPRECASNAAAQAGAEWR